MKNTLKSLGISFITLALLPSLSVTAGEISLGVLGGKTDISNNCELSAIGVVSECTPDVDNQALGINLGYAVNDNIGVEVGYLDLGDVRLDFGERGNLFAEIDLSPTVIYGAAVGSVALSSNISASGRLGYYDIETDTFPGLYAISVPEGFSVDTLSDSDIYAGASLDYAFSDNLSA